MRQATVGFIFIIGILVIIGGLGFALLYFSGVLKSPDSNSQATIVALNGTIAAQNQAKAQPTPPPTQVPAAQVQQPVSQAQPPAPQVVIVTPTPVPVVQQVAAAPSQTSAPAVSNTQPQASASGWFTSCPMIQEAPDGSIYERPVPTSPYECDFRPSIGGSLVFNGISAKLTAGGTTIADHVNGQRVQIIAGTMYHIKGDDKNGGFSLEKG